MRFVKKVLQAVCARLDVPGEATGAPCVTPVSDTHLCAGGFSTRSSSWKSMASGRQNTKSSGSL